MSRVFLSTEGRDVNKSHNFCILMDNKELNQCISKIIADRTNCYEESKRGYHGKEGSKRCFFKGIKK